MQTYPLNEKWLTTAILVFLWGALIEDIFLVLMSWGFPDLWFHVFHNTEASGLDITWLRRSGGQWAAFVLAQAIALWRWRKESAWLAIMAGVRFSDLFTDISYIVSAPALTTIGLVLLIPPPFLNLLGVCILLRGYRQASANLNGQSSKGYQ